MGSETPACRLSLPGLVFLAALAALGAFAPLACGKGAAPAGRDAGAPASGAACGVGGPRAAAQLAPVSGAAPSGFADAAPPAPVVGTATFETTAEGVDLKIGITGCVAGNAYPVVIREAAACDGAMAAGPDWDPPRGDGIAFLTCTGGSGVGVLYYSRPSGDPKPWTVGGPSSSDVLGHVLLVEDPTTMQALACGPIAAAPDDGGASSAPDASPAVSVAIRAQVAGLCLVQSWSPTAGCPDPQKVADCGCTHCDLGPCLNQCSGYVACLASQPDAGCASPCPLDPNCTQCVSEMPQCLLGFCSDILACSTPAPGGACSQLRACCATQNGSHAAQCLAGVEEIEKLGGDTGCTGAMHDGDFLLHAAGDPPCSFDDAGPADGSVD